MPSQEPAELASTPLTPSLFTIFQNYKRSTSVVIDWLASNGSERKKKESGPSALAVNQILRAAEAISKRKLTAPQYVKGTFKSTLVNRRRITERFRRNQAGGDEEDATERHKHFNETLAQAYEALFLPNTKANAKKQTQPNSSPDKEPIVMTNRFELLSNLIEKEPEYEDFIVMKSKDIPTPGQSAIEDDPIEMALAKYFRTPKEERDANILLEDLSVMTISRPELPTLPEHKAGPLLNAINARIEFETQSVESILRSIKQLLDNKKNARGKATRLDDSGYPLLFELRQYLGYPGIRVDTELVFGLNLLLESTKAFIFKGEDVNGVNCRIRTLQFAKEFQNCIKEITDHMNPRMAENHSDDMMVGLLNIKDMLKDFIADPRLDLYYQSPWVAGCQTVEFLSLALAVGMNLMNQRGIVACQIFLGSRPTRNFQTIWHRYQGGSIQNDGGMRKMGLPKKRDKDGDWVKKRIHTDSLSFFHDHFDTGYQGSPAFWASALTNGKEKKIKDKDLNRIERELKDKPMTDILLKMKNLVEPEFSSSIPIARINFLAIYKLCSEV
ncbi:hypothetical protein K469DRAFT_785271 [Zopfia rhizophila CBS 207.26]|uniref:DUF6604 domain-containing protein n=1 Tax=Zopfia rhizophila CBS 207.26 TaxID=1314779 RepID=A0A6A6DVX2_9PEZI|nr:hypothetical protein K469DRAFT_785271 [Zopfia rhizophila CBS 207.26]